MVLNVKFHLFQEMIDLYSVVIVSDKTNHKIQEMIDIPEMIEAQDIPEMIEVVEKDSMIKAEKIATVDVVDGSNCKT